MDLWVIRHGPALARAANEPGDADAARPLTGKGARRMRRVAQALSASGVRFERLRFSPWRRAVETAEWLAPLVEGELEVSSLLRTAPTPQLVASLDAEREALVGHEPWLGELVGMLTVGAPQHAAALRLSKGGVAHLRGTPRPGEMQLHALYPGRALERWGR